MCSTNTCWNCCRDCNHLNCCATTNTNEQKENNADNVNPKIVITQPRVNIIYKNFIEIIL